MGLAGIELATPATREKKKKRDLKGNAGGGDRTHDPQFAKKKKGNKRGCEAWGSNPRPQS